MFHPVIPSTLDNTSNFPILLGYSPCFIQSYSHMGTCKIKLITNPIWRLLLHLIIAHTSPFSSIASNLLILIPILAQNFNPDVFPLHFSSYSHSIIHILWSFTP